MDSAAGARYAGDESAHLLVADSIASGRTLELRPQGIGFAGAITPAYALGGAGLVALTLAAVAALGFALAALVARRIVPEPWATAGPALAGLSPPAIAHATAVYPEALAGTLLTGAALAALRLREHEHLRDALLGALALAALPWLGPKYVLPAAPVAVLLVRWMARRGHQLPAVATAEVMLGSLVFYVALNDRLFGGFTPYAALRPGGHATGASSPGDYLERLPRLASLWIDRDVGLLRWAPVLALSLFSAWLLWRSRRARVSRVAPDRLGAEIAAALLLAVCAAVVAGAVLGAPSVRGPWFPGRHLAAALPLAGALAAWGLRHARRTGAALGALTLLASGWLGVQLATGSVASWAQAPDSTAPWGPAERLLPLYGGGSPWATAVAIALGIALLGLVARETWNWRRRGPAHATLR